MNPGGLKAASWGQKAASWGPRQMPTESIYVTGQLREERERGKAERDIRMFAYRDQHAGRYSQAFLSPLSLCCIFGHHFAAVSYKESSCKGKHSA
eukprot:1154239-Pelagomonas_calceolata.AAC.13